MRYNVLLIAALSGCDNSLSGIILMDPPLQTAQTGDTGNTETDADTDADSDSDTDADTDTAVHTAHTGIPPHTAHTGETGVYLNQLCLTAAAGVVGQVEVYVFETNLDDTMYWVDPVQVPVTGTPFASGNASAPVCGDMRRVTYASGHTLLVLAVNNPGIGEQSLVTGNSVIKYTSYVLAVELSGSALRCASFWDPLAAPYAYTSCTLP